MAYKNAYGAITAPMSLNAGALDDLTASANDGTLSGATLTGNGYLSFVNATDNVLFTRTDYQYTGNDAFTFIIIAKTSKNNASTERIFSVADLGGTSNYIRHSYAATTNRYTFGIHGGTLAAPVPTNTVNDGKWHVIIGVESGIASRSVYIDGATPTTNTTNTGAGNLYTANTKASLGAAWNNTAAAYQGCGTWENCFFGHINSAITVADAVNVVNEFNMLL